MPVEIRELVIRATVDSGGGSAAAGGAGAGSGTNASPGDELIRTCVEKVLEILKEKNER